MTQLLFGQCSKQQVNSGKQQQIYAIKIEKINKQDAIPVVAVVAGARCSVWQPDIYILMMALKWFSKKNKKEFEKQENDDNEW